MSKRGSGVKTLKIHSVNVRREQFQTKLKIEDFYPLLWGIGHYADRNIHLTRQTEHNKYATRLISLVTFNVIMLVGGVILSDYIIDSNNLIKKEQNNGL